MDVLMHDESRRALRALIFQLLYALDAFDYEEPVENIVQEFNKGFDLTIAADSEAVLVVKKIVEKKVELDAMLLSLSTNWKPERIGCCTRLILYLGLWELLYTDTPTTIIINEAIELAKGFAEKDAHKFINGVLDQALKKIEERKAALASLE